jgi:hypothetical protein
MHRYFVEESGSGAMRAPLLKWRGVHGNQPAKYAWLLGRPPPGHSTKGCQAPVFSSPRAPIEWPIDRHPVQLLGVRSLAVSVYRSIAAWAVAHDSQGECLRLLRSDVQRRGVQRVQHVHGVPLLDAVDASTALR